ncbi:MAG: hypothetical protein OQK52_11390 [Ignavibacteriaceae bacterium]|jgi:hypothetical protein|nr:hypothetical protein [Ignavibacteriaceae bacterium]MCW8818463.1 hypothetical protein [Ignavibacteriaceae bacterium]MCW8961078.1 hypothetical protein [Ignavibacteriaceae bacterium]MCW9094383.1 hypothetical protein [Ignavibacteriaceae bacterium]
MNSKFSDEKFIENVERYTANPFFLKEDVERLIGVVAEKGKEEEFEELIFTSKYVCGLIRIVKNSTGVPEVNSIEHIKEDLNENIKKGIEQIRGIISANDGKEKDYFEKTFLTPTTQSFNNLYQLFSDLEAIKKYVNYLKRLS